MIPVSTSPAVRRYLFEHITSALTPDPLNKRASLLVCYDDPGPNQPDDVVAIGTVTRSIATNSVVGGGGAGWLEERYTVAITIDVFRGGDDVQAAYDRSSLLSDAVVDVVRQDPSLGGLVLVARPTLSTHEVTWDEQHLGRHALTELTVECYQRI